MSTTGTNPPPPSTPSTGTGGTGVNVPPIPTGPTGENVQSGQDPVGSSRQELAEDRYDDLTVDELQDQIDQRNEEKDEEDRISRSGRKADLISRLKEDDERAGSDSTTSDQVEGVEVVQETVVGEGVARTYSTGTDSPALRPFNDDPDHVNPADQEAAERYEQQEEAAKAAAEREAPDADKLLRPFSLEESETEDEDEEEDK